ncbi:MAG: aminotransferase class V-fold PLP-dependent enzyme, partial [Aerococcus suis]|nr:aminotransferase class V-fold PLP-dependent enzyme [Aerococcus suis]
MTNIYFDNSATTKIFPEVIQSMVETMENYYGNPSSLHSLGTEANQLLQAARQQIADAFECEADEIYFTSGGTESNNWVLRGTATAKREFGRHIITTQVEHPSVQNTMNALE